MGYRKGWGGWEEPAGSDQLEKSKPGPADQLLQNHAGSLLKYGDVSTLSQACLMRRQNPVQGGGAGWVGG